MASPSLGLMLYRARLGGRPEVCDDVCTCGSQTACGLSRRALPGGRRRRGIPRLPGSRPASPPPWPLLWPRMIRQWLRHGYRMVIAWLECGGHDRPAAQVAELPGLAIDERAAEQDGEQPGVPAPGVAALVVAPGQPERDAAGGRARG